MKWFNIESKADVGEIYITDAIGEWGQSVNDFQKEFNQIKDKRAIRVYINSPGGSVTDGWSIYNIISKYRDKVEVEVIGMAASIASVIALSGSKLIMNKGTYYMIHRASTLMWGSAKDLRKTADLMEMMETDIVNLYETKTALTRDEIIQAMEDETWYTASEALDVGFADMVNDTPAIAAKFNGDVVNHIKIPEELKAVETEVEVVDVKNEEVEVSTQDILGEEKNRNTAICIKRMEYNLL